MGALSVCTSDWASLVSSHWCQRGPQSSVSRTVSRVHKVLDPMSHEFWLNWAR
ncbi:hypothetical protein ASPCADRAFT_210987 [Aspergillus carbonarius ITEM 5010]|uniref:Uncharacterized protein n=1 Tax=Aspergillus carbonarius (strain ITEM 5010) TaxID=602072 RepID=A0A1R3RB07_ASPC5|nr:hypothetical protein ASPCADRAFT_210987 [Aspergillus carbonarius ITEM 5010]